MAALPLLRSRFNHAFTFCGSSWTHRKGFYAVFGKALSTADICDKYGDSVQYLDSMLQNFGGVHKFSGQISTVSCNEDNSKVKAALAEAGTGKVLVVDGGGCLRRALLGDLIAKEAIKNGWSGVIINGCVRDSVELSQLPLGIKALGCHPRKCIRRDAGERDVHITFGNVTFVPGHFVHADEDGVVISDKILV